MCALLFRLAVCLVAFWAVALTVLSVDGLTPPASTLPVAMEQAGSKVDLFWRATWSFIGLNPLAADDVRGWWNDSDHSWYPLTLGTQTLVVATDGKARFRVVDEGFLRGLPKQFLAPMEPVFAHMHNYLVDASSLLLPAIASVLVYNRLTLQYFRVVHSRRGKGRSHSSPHNSGPTCGTLNAAGREFGYGWFAGALAIVCFCLLLGVVGAACYSLMANRAEIAYANLYGYVPVRRGLCVAFCSLDCTIPGAWLTIYAVILVSCCAIVAIIAYHYVHFPYWVPSCDPQCSECGYLLLGIASPRCPECGTDTGYHMHHTETGKTVD